MNVPGWQLHVLSGKPKPIWSVWVNGNWRLTFTFDGEDAVLVDYLTTTREPPWHACSSRHTPGATLKEDVLPALGLTVTDAARQLESPVPPSPRILNGHAAISPEMARRIEAWLARNAVAGRKSGWGCRWITICGWQSKTRAKGHVCTGIEGGLIPQESASSIIPSR